MKTIIIESERTLLFELGFEIHLLLDIPHRYISGILKCFEKHKRQDEILREIWRTLNDAYRSNICVFYPCQIIAAASISHAFRIVGEELPECAWWILLEATN